MRKIKSFKFWDYQAKNRNDEYVQAYFNGHGGSKNAESVEYYEFGFGHVFYVAALSYGLATEWIIFEPENGDTVEEFKDGELQSYKEPKVISKLFSKDYTDCFHYNGEEYTHFCGNLPVYIEILQFIQADHERRYELNELKKKEK